MKKQLFILTVIFSTIFTSSRAMPWTENLFRYESLHTNTVNAFVQQDDADENAQSAPSEGDMATTTQEMDSSDAEMEEEEEIISMEDDFQLDEEVDEQTGIHQVIKEKFIEGGANFMWPILICLILGLAVAIERIITLNMATTNTGKLLGQIEASLAKGGVEAAKKVTKDTRGPVASIFTQGLMRYSEGIEMVEKSIISYGGVEMGRLEKGLVWVSLFISLGPMLGFFGTVVGMIAAFDAIEAAGDISPQVVAGGMKTALLTTVGGLIVGIILQVFYNYLTSKIDSLVNNMEEASISLVDLLIKHNIVKKK